MPSPTVLVLNDDRCLADSICRGVREVWSSATVIIERSVSGARQQLNLLGIDWLITGLDLLEEDAYGLIRNAGWLGKPQPMIFVYTSRRNPRTLAWLAELPIHGAFDSCEEPLVNLPVALRVVESGKRYFSPSFTRLLRDPKASGLDVLRLLSPAEELMLATIGDGSDDQTAAQRLGLSDATVHATRKNLHWKLDARSRSELMASALRLGHVRATAQGLKAVGFDLLLAHCEARRRRSGLKAPPTETMTKPGKHAAA
jgi:DNA-binding NarL/FixJ family response regulator